MEPIAKREVPEAPASALRVMATRVQPRQFKGPKTKPANEVTDVNGTDTDVVVCPDIQSVKVPAPIEGSQTYSLIEVLSNCVEPVKIINSPQTSAEIVAEDFPGGYVLGGFRSIIMKWLRTELAELATAADTDTGSRALVGLISEESGTTAMKDGSDNRMEISAIETNPEAGIASNEIRKQRTGLSIYPEGSV